MFYPKKYNLLLLLMTAMLFISCDNVLDSGDDAPPVDWENGQTIVEADDEHLSETEVQEWRKSAVELALRTISETDSTKTEIPSELIDLYYNALIHVVNSGIGEAEKATSELEIYARERMKHGEVLVIPDIEASSEWLDAWRSGATETGFEPVDELLERFSLELSSYSEPGNQSYGMALLRTDELLNPLGLAAEFLQVEGISNSEANYIVGDGSDIRATIHDAYVSLRYELKWGDCPAGCIHTSFWEFSVDVYGNVQLIDQGGDEITQDAVE